MQIVIDIPKEFEEHFKSDRFEDSLSRVASDIESFGFELAGRYEKETITMLREAIKNGTPLPEHHGDLVDRDAINCRFYDIWEELESYSNKPSYKELLDKWSMCMDTAPTIIEGSDDE